MNDSTQRIYSFLTACSGNWRNTIYISTQNESGGHLMAFSRDGKPLFMAVCQLQQLSGESIDPCECRGQLSESSLKDIFAQYLLWQLPTEQDSPLENL